MSKAKAQTAQARYLAKFHQVRIPLALYKSLKIEAVRRGVELTALLVEKLKTRPAAGATSEVSTNGR